MPEPVPATLAEALAQLQGRLPRVAKDKPGQAGQGRYLYADLTDCTEALFPIMSELGLSFTSRPTLVSIGAETRFVLHYELMHSGGGGVLSGEYPLPSTGSPQQVGGAITYARRYTLCAVTGLAPGGDDDDAASAEAAHHEARKQPRNVPDAQLAASGRMTRGQKSAHEQLAADTQRGGHLERDRPRGPDPDDPWAQDAPVDHERAARLRADLDRELPEDKPGTSTYDQQKAIGMVLAKKGIGDRDDRLAYCGHVTGREIASSKELSYNEAAAVLAAAGKLENVNA